MGTHYREITKYTLRIEPYVDIAVAVLFIELTDCYERCRVALHEGQEEGSVPVWKSLFRTVTPTLQWLLLACTILSCSLNLALINIQ